MKNTLFLLLVAIVLYSCKEEKNDVLPALDFIKNDIRDIDTSIYPIIKLVPLTDSTFDTSFIKREEVRGLAKDFLETPDITKNFGGKYTETKMMDEQLGQAIFTATPSDDKLEVRRQEVRIKPSNPNDDIKSVYIEKFKDYRDSTVTKRLTWYINRKFQVVTITEKNNKSNTNVFEVIWNEKKLE